MPLSTSPKKFALLYWQTWQIVSFLNDTFFPPKSFVKGICILGNGRTGPNPFSLASMQREPWKIVLFCGEVVGRLLKHAFFAYDRVDDKPHYLSAHDLGGRERHSFQLPHISAHGENRLCSCSCAHHCGQGNGALGLARPEPCGIASSKERGVWPAKKRKRSWVGQQYICTQTKKAPFFFL